MRGAKIHYPSTLTLFQKATTQALTVPINTKDRYENGIRTTVRSFAAPIR